MSHYQTQRTDLCSFVSLILSLRMPIPIQPYILVSFLGLYIWWNSINIGRVYVEKSDCKQCGIIGSARIDISYSSPSRVRLWHLPRSWSNFTSYTHFPLEFAAERNGTVNFMKTVNGNCNRKTYLKQRNLDISQTVSFFHSIFFYHSFILWCNDKVTVSSEDV